MDIDELDPLTKKTKLKNLEIMSLESLSEYIEELEIEILRARKEITEKEKARQGAEAIFTFKEKN